MGSHEINTKPNAANKEIENQQNEIENHQMTNSESCVFTNVWADPAYHSSAPVRIRLAGVTLTSFIWIELSTNFFVGMRIR